MRNLHHSLAGIAAGMLISLNSCAYDPSYGISGYPSSGDGFWGGYGYGGGSVSTSVFVSTGNPRWAYDPSCFSYYDRSRRCYYDPVLCAYYPAGHRPSVYGRSHPHGWHRGSSHCPPPSQVRDVCISRDRLGSAHASREHRSNHSWFAANSRHRESHQHRNHETHAARVFANTAPNRQTPWPRRDSADQNSWRSRHINPPMTPSAPSTAAVSLIASPEPHRPTSGWASRIRENRQDSTSMTGSFSPPASGGGRSWDGHPHRRESTHGLMRPPSTRGFGNTTRDARGSSHRTREATVPPPPAPASAPAPDA